MKNQAVWAAVVRQTQLVHLHLVRVVNDAIDALFMPFFRYGISEQPGWNEGPQ